MESRAVKMAAGAIRVCVLEGIYAKMTELGLPLSLAVELQSRGLRLNSSLWTARLSNGRYSVSLFWPSQRRHPRRRRQRRKPKPGHQPISSFNPVRSGKTVGSSYVQKDTTTNRLPPGFSLKASSQVDSELKAVEDGDLEKTSLTSSHSAVKDSWTFDSEGEANYTCPTPTTDWVWGWKGQSQVLPGCSLWEPGWCSWDIGSWRERWAEVDSSIWAIKKRVRLNEVQLQRFPAHCRPSQPSDTETSSSDWNVPLTIPMDAEVKYSVIDGTPGLSIATMQ